MARMARSSHAMGSLWGEFGHVACKVGAAEGDGVASLQLSGGTNERLDKAFAQVTTHRLQLQCSRSLRSPHWQHARVPRQAVAAVLVARQ